MRPRIMAMTNNTRNIKNRIFAIPAVLAAIPPNPNTPAIIAIMKKIMAQRSIIYFFNGENELIGSRKQIQYKKTNDNPIKGNIKKSCHDCFIFLLSKKKRM